MKDATGYVLGNSLPRVWPAGTFMLRCHMRYAANRRIHKIFTQLQQLSYTAARLAVSTRVAGAAQTLPIGVRTSEIWH